MISRYSDLDCNPQECAKCGQDDEGSRMVKNQGRWVSEKEVGIH